jgi:hypothetical protein
MRIRFVFAAWFLSACSGAPNPAVDPPLPDASRDATEDQVEVSDVLPSLDRTSPPPDVTPVTDVIAVDAPAPIRAPDNTWTWIDVPGSVCGNGRPTGFGVNLRAGVRNVLIFLQGGGACWDGTTCFGTSTATYFSTGYGSLEFATDIARASMLFLRRESANPFRDFNMVYVPYCTGDIHAGNRVATYDFFGPRMAHHVGARNLALFLPRIAATFPDAQRVFLAGDSAGGFGSAFNLPRVQATFSSVRVSVIDDSGPPIQPNGDRWRLWSTNWGMEIPSDCPACAMGVDAFTTYYRERYPNNRYAILSYNNDAVISTFMNIDAFTFGTRLRTLTDTIDRSWPNARYFVTPGLLHVLQAQIIRPPGFDDWIRRFVDGDTTLRSIRP